MVTRKRHHTAILGLLFATAMLAAEPASAQQSAQGWRALCVPGSEVEILVGSSWYRGIVTGPSEFGDELCGVLNSSYSGREMGFAMAPERMRAVQAPGIPSPRVGPAPVLGAPSQEAWRALCLPGAEVEILVGNAWYKSVVIGPDELGREACGVLNTSYSGSELRFAMEPDRMRAVRPAESADQAGLKSKAPAAPSITANLAEIGEAYRSNIVAARQAYEDRTVTLTSTLQSVGSDYIRLEDGPFGVAMCNFDEGQREQLASLSPGAQLTVRGEDSSWGWGTFQLRSCQILREQIAQAVPHVAQAQMNGRPPLGRYVCRQYMTTIGWIDLSENGYAVSGVQGSYSYDPVTGDIVWDGGAYAGWPARYEFSPAGAGHAHDESIIRMTDDAGELRIDCFLTSE